MKEKEINKPKKYVVKKERRIQLTLSVKSVIYFFLFSFICFFIWFILENNWIIISLVKEKNRYESLLFSVIVSMSLLMFMLACGLDIKYSNKYLKIFIISVMIWIIYYGYYNYGLRLDFKQNFGLLNYTIYESNTKKGLLFFILNWLFWSYLYVVSLIFMSSE